MARHWPIADPPEEEPLPSVEELLESTDWPTQLSRARRLRNAALTERGEEQRSLRPLPWESPDYLAFSRPASRPAFPLPPGPDDATGAPATEAAPADPVPLEPAPAEPAHDAAPADSEPSEPSGAGPHAPEPPADHVAGLPVVVRPALPAVVRSRDPAATGAMIVSLAGSAVLFGLMMLRVLGPEPVAATVEVATLVAPAAEVVDPTPPATSLAPAAPRQAAIVAVPAPVPASALGLGAPPAAPSAVATLAAGLAPVEVEASAAAPAGWSDSGGFDRVPVALGPIAGAGPQAHILVHVPDGLAPGVPEAVVSALRAAGFDAPTLGPVAFRVSATHVRYYHASDRPLALRVAGAVGGEARDFTDFRPSPPVQTVEVWLAGNARAAARPPEPVPEERPGGLRGALSRIFGPPSTP